MRGRRLSKRAGEQLKRLATSIRTLRGESRLALARLRARLAGRPDDRARWLIRFAAVDVAKLSSAEWQELRWELAAFVISDREFEDYRLSGSEPWFPYPEEEIRRHQELIRTGFERLADRDPWLVATEGYPIRWILLRDGATVTGGNFTGGQSFEDRFKEKVCDALLRVGPRLRFCLVCRVPFLARGRQIYCTKRCSAQARTRRFRRKHAEQLSERRHAVYVRAQRAKHGPKLRVTRKKRRASTLLPLNLDSPREPLRQEIPRAVLDRPIKMDRAKAKKSRKLSKAKATGWPDDDDEAIDPEIEETMEYEAEAERYATLFRRDAAKRRSPRR